MNVVETSTMGISMIGLLVLLVLLGMLVGGVVLVGVLLANRKTRGLTTLVLAVAGVVVVLAAWLFLHEARMEKGRQVANFQVEPLRQFKIDEDTQELQFVPDNAFKIDEDTQVLQFVPDDAARAPMPTGQAIVHRSRAKLLLAPVGLIALFVFAGVVFIAFKHGGMGIGLTALCLPVVLLFVSYHSVRRPAQVTMIDSSRTYTEPRYVGEPVDVPYAIDVTDSGGGEREDTPKVIADEDSGESGEKSPEKTKRQKPAWITTPPKRVGNVYRRVLQAGPYSTVDECQQRIGYRIESAVRQYVGEMADAEMHGRASHPPFDRFGISPRYIRENLVREEYYETVVSSVSDDMKTLYVLFEIDAQAHDRLMDHWRAYERKERIAVVGVGAGGLLAALAGVLGLIKLDTRTKGAYTKRLFIGVPLPKIGGFLLLFIS